MAKIYLEGTDLEDFKIANDGTTIIGTSSVTDSIAIAADVTGVIVDSTIEQIDLSGSIADYTFEKAASFGTGFNVYNADGVKVFNFTVNSDKALSFTDGTVAVTYTDSTIFVGGTAITTTAAAVIPTTIDADNVTSVTITGTVVDPVVPETDTTVKNGDTVEFTFETTETTEVSYTIAGVDAADVVGGADSLTGTATVTDGSATVAVTLRADVDNSAKTIELFLAGVLEDSVEVSTIATTDTTISTTDIAVADGGFITQDAGNTGTANFTVSSSDADTTLSAKVVIGGDANLNITAGSGSDTFIIDGAGNAVVDAGAGLDKIYLNSGNDVVVIADGEFAADSIIDGGTGVNTIAVSGTNDLTAGTSSITNIQNLVIEDAANVTIGEDEVALMTSIIANGTTAKLTINEDANTETIDLTSVLTGSLAKLTLESANVSVQLTAEQITAITAFTLNGGEIVTDAAGAEVLATKGITPTIDAGDALTLEVATTTDIAADSYVSYEIDTTAEEVFDELYLGGKASEQLADTTGVGITTATINVSDTATVAEAKAIKTGVDAIGTAYAVSDTAANIAASATQTITIQFTTAASDATTNTVTIGDVTFSTAGGKTLTELANGFAGVNIAASTMITNIASDGTDTITITAYDTTGALTINASDTAAEGTVTVTEQSWLNATEISSLTIEGASTVDDIQKIFAANDALATAITASEASDTDALTMTTPSYTITDTTAKIVGAIADTSVLNATSVTLSTDETLTVAQAVTVTGALGTKLTSYNIDNTAALLAAATTAVRNGATDISANTVATVIEATKIAGFDNTGTTTYDMTDDAAKLFTAQTAVLEGATVVKSNDALTLAQAAKIAPYFADDYAWTLSDTGANLTSEAALAFYETFTALIVTPTDALTIAQAVTLEAEAATANQIATLNAYDMEDTAANFTAALTETSDDTLDNTEGQTTASSNVEELIEAAMVANTVTATGTFTSEEIVALKDVVVDATDGAAVNIITNAAFVYNLEDTAAIVSADASDVTTCATEVTITTAATAAQAETLQDIIIVDALIVDSFTYDVESTYTELFAVINTAGTFVAGNDKGNDALLAATTVTATVDGDNTIANAASIAILSGERVDAGSSAIAYSISDNTTQFELLDATTADTDQAFLDGAVTVEVVDTGAEIKNFAEVADADVYAYVDSYAIEITSESNGTPLSDDIAAAPLYYDGATSITITDADLAVADANDDYDLIVAEGNETKLVFADIAGAKAAFAGLDADAIATVGKATQVSVTDVVNVSEANAIDTIVSGTLLLEASLTDTTANLLTAASLFTSASTIAASDNATVAQHETLIDMMQTAELVGDDEALLIAHQEILTVTTEDTIDNVQNASAVLLSTLGDNTTGNTISLKAGSEIAMTIAQATGLADVDNADLANIDDPDGTDATYEIIDTIENIINQIHTENNNGGTLGDMLTYASSIIATDNGVVIPEAYLAHLETLVADTAFDTVNSTYSISGLAATLDGGNVDTAVINADTVTVTDEANLVEAADIYGNNTNVTFSSIENVDTGIFDIDADNVATYDSEAIETMVGLAAEVTLITDALSVDEATAITALLGAKPVTYILEDTAANLAAAGTLLANATGITVANGADAKATVAQITAINAGVDTDVLATADIVYDLEDTATNLAAADQILYTDVDATVSQVADDTATIAEAEAIETKEAAGAAATIALVIEDSAANVVAGIADAYTEGLDAGAADTITLTTTATMAEATTLVTYTGNIETDVSVSGLDAMVAGDIYVEDTAANLLAATADYADTVNITVTDSINVSKAKQIETESGLALTAITYDIDETQVYTIQAFTENNDVLGAANTITVTDVGTISVDLVSNAGTYFITGSVAELTALPAELLAVGFIVNDTVAAIAAADVSITESDSLEATVVTDTAANIAAADLTVTGVAAEVHVTDTVDAAALTAMQSTGLNIYSIAGVSDTVANLTAATLDYTVQDGITAVTVTDGSVTDAEITALVVKTNVAGAANVVYTLEDEVGNLDLTGADDFLENAAAVTITDAVSVVQADDAYALNNAVTMSITDVKGALDVLIETDISTAEQAEIDAINAATSVSLTAGQVVSVEIASALVALGDSFDGVYTLSDTAAALSAADATLLANAVQVELSAGTATVAEATILTALTNFKPLAETGDDSVYAAMTITDTAVNIAAADATLLDNAKTITFLAADTTDDDVTAAQAQALSVLDANTAIVGLDLAADTAQVVDTYANITDAVNADGVFDAAEVTVTDAITLAQAQAVNTANDNGDVLYDLSDTRSHLQGATQAEAGFAENVNVSDDLSASQVGIIDGLYNDGGTNNADITYANVTGTAAELTAALVAQATTVTVTDALEVSELMTAYTVPGTFDGGFLAIVGDKLTGGYTIEDGVDAIVNAALNNDYSNAVVANATDIALTAGDEDMNIAASSVITALNFSGAYTITDTATEVSAAAATLINGATTVTVTFEDGISENFDASAYTNTVVLDLRLNGADVTTAVASVVTLTTDNVDVITLDTAGNTTLMVDMTSGVLGAAAYNQAEVGATGLTIEALDLNEFALFYGYRTGDGFKIDTANAEDTLFVYTDKDDSDAEQAVVLEGIATFSFDTFTVSGSGNDTLDLSTGTVANIILNAEGDDTIVGFTVGAAADTITTVIDVSAATFQSGAAAELDFGTNGVNVVAADTANASATMTAAEVEAASITGFTNIGVDETSYVALTADTDAASDVYIYHVTANGAGDDILSVEFVAQINGVIADDITTDNFILA